MRVAVNLTRKLSDLAAMIAQGLIVIMMTVMAVVVIIQVYVRYIAKSSFPWSEELARYLMAWVAFMGSSLGIRTGEHVGVELFIRLFPKKAQDWIALTTRVLILSFLGVVIKEGYFLCLDLAFQRSPALMISMFWPYFSVPAGCSLMFLQILPSFLENIDDILRGLKRVSDGEIATRE